MFEHSQDQNTKTVVNFVVNLMAEQARTNSGDHFMLLNTAPKFSSLSIFNNLTVEELNRLEAHMHYQTCPAGRHLIFAEQPGDLIYIILEGSIKVYVEHLDGNEVILAIQSAPGRLVREVPRPGRCQSSAGLR